MHPSLRSASIAFQIAARETPHCSARASPETYPLPAFARSSCTFSFVVILCLFCSGILFSEHRKIVDRRTECYSASRLGETRKSSDCLEDILQLIAFHDNHKHFFFGNNVHAEEFCVCFLSCSARIDNSAAACSRFS